MKSFRVYIVDTWYGAISVCSLWCICCLLLYAWLGVYGRMETLLIGLYVVQAVLFFVTLCVGLVNFMSSPALKLSLRKTKWRMDQQGK